MQRSPLAFVGLALVSYTTAGRQDAITVVQIVADDLGRQDLGYFNGGKTVTPHINDLISQGVFLGQYHTYKVCAPSRAAIMTYAHLLL